jgi:hypothetical protein
MPDINQLLQSNPEAFQAVTPPAPSVEPTDSNLIASVTSGVAPSWQQMRGGRSRRAFSQPGVLDEVGAHHNAIADASAYDSLQAHNLAAYHAAQTYHDTAAFHQAVHGISPKDPDAEMKLMQLGQDHPFAKPDAELMKPWYEARKQYTDMNGATEQLRQFKDDQKFIMDATAAGHLVQSDLQDPQFQDANGRVSVPALRYQAALRASGQAPGGVVQPKLSKEEAGEWKSYNTAPDVYDRKILKSTDTTTDKNFSPAVAAKKALFYSALGKMRPGGSAAPAAAAPASALPPDVKSTLGF